MPRTTLSTPLGSPASVKISARRIAHSGVSSAGFSTTVFPQTSAGAIFQIGIATGKFHGVIRPTTPSGCFSVYAKFFGSRWAASRR